MKNVHLKNFQAHRDTKFTLHPGVNVFIGASDKGKSSIYRALDWVINNVSGKGDSFTPFSGGNPDVTIDGVRRFRSKSKNEYYISGNKEPLKAFYQKPPAEVVEYFNMADINWSGQHAPHFLVSNTSGEVARILNSAVDLNIIDESQKKVSSAKRDAKTKVNLLNKQLAEALEGLESYGSIEAQSKRLDRCRSFSKKLESLTKSRDKISSFISKINRIETELNIYPDLDMLSERVQKLLVDKIENNKQEVLRDTIKKTINRLKDIQDDIDSYSNLPRIEIALKKVMDLKKDLAEVTKERSLINNCIISYKRKDGLILEVKKELKDLTKQMPEVCPLCGGIFNGKK